MAGHTNFVKSVEFSTDGTRVVSASLDQTAFLWDGLTGERIAALRGRLPGCSQGHVSAQTASGL